MSEKIKELEERFRAAADIAGYCPLPDPDTDGTKAVEHPSLMRILPQPTGYDYDATIIAADNKRFRSEVLKMVRNKQITKEQAQELLKI